MGESAYTASICFLVSIIEYFSLNKAAERRLCLRGTSSAMCFSVDCGAKGTTDFVKPARYGPHRQEFRPVLPGLFLRHPHSGSQAMFHLLNGNSLLNPAVPGAAGPPLAGWSLWHECSG